MTVKIADKEMIRITHPNVKYYVEFANKTKVRAFTNKKDADRFDRLVNPRTRRMR